MRVVIGFIAFITGCASFNSGNVETFDRKKLLSVQTNKIVYSATQVAKYQINEKEYTYSVDHRIQSYGLFNPPGSSSIDICKINPCKDLSPDIQIYVDYSKNLKTGQNAIGFDTLLFILTLGLYPASEEYEYKMDAVVVDKNKKILGSYHYVDSVKTYYQLFLLFISPFMNTQSESETLANMSGKIILEADSLNAKPKPITTQNN